MTAGRRNRLIRIERATAARDGYGGQDKTWAKHCDEWAAVVFQPGRERREAAQEQASAVATFTVLANARTSDTRVTDRIVFDGSYWNITSNIPSKQFNAERDIEAIREVE